VGRRGFSLSNLTAMQTYVITFLSRWILDIVSLIVLGLNTNNQRGIWLTLEETIALWPVLGVRPFVTALWDCNINNNNNNMNNNSSSTSNHQYDHTNNTSSNNGIDMSNSTNCNGMKDRENILWAAVSFNIFFFDSICIYIS